MERIDILAMMGALKLFGMKDYDEIIRRSVTLEAAGGHAAAGFLSLCHPPCFRDSKLQSLLSMRALEHGDDRQFAWPTLRPRRPMRRPTCPVGKR
ncbi:MULTISPECIES: hypothetical protein [Chelativorans]|uniref:Uncharacterized protein n=1 Tax=Chelativorans intermedius TaxID=515947 RepID=A0ABV6DD61_9HYPH|nr:MULTISPECIES: hypothetical protein [Chelativorans]MCT9000575.1 hypothetical protein [Chelativorans intermedius]WEX12181.1 hypothetical protein PVE73_26020 [Chelativorans sp. AA-79]